MTREIDFTKPLNSDELLYVRDRPWLKQEAELQGYTIQSEDDEFVVEDGDAERAVDPNLAMVQDYQTPEEADGDDEAEELPDDYNEWTVEQLKAELKQRELPVSGSKEQLVDRLSESDEAEDDE